MKKRVLSLVLALLLCVGLAVPAFAASDVSEGLTKVSVVGKNNQTLYGYQDQNGRAVIPTEYERLDDFKDGVVLGQKQGQYYLLNGNGAVLATLDYEYIGYFNQNGYAEVRKTHTADYYKEMRDTYDWRIFWLQYGDPEKDSILRAFQEEYGTEYKATSLYDLEQFIQYVSNNTEEFLRKKIESGLYDSGAQMRNEEWIWYALDELLTPDGESAWSWYGTYEEFNRYEALRELWEKSFGGERTLYGVIDQKGKEVIAPRYQYLDMNSVTRSKDAIVGTYDMDGVLRLGTIDGVPMEYDTAKFDGGGIVVGMKDSAESIRYGFYKYTTSEYGFVTGAEELLPVEYDMIRAEGERVLVVKDGKYGYLGKDGTWDTPVEKTWVDPASQKTNTTVSKGQARDTGSLYGIGAIVLVAGGILLVIILKPNKKQKVTAEPVAMPETAFQAEESISPTMPPASEEEPETVDSGFKFCSACGKPVDPTAKFCPECGHSLKVEENTHEA